MRVFVSTVNPLISCGAKIVLMMVLVVSFIGPAYAYTQEELWKHLDIKTNILYKRGQYLEAFDVAKDALKVAEETFGFEHPNMALSLNNMASLYHRTGQICRS